MTPKRTAALRYHSGPAPQEGAGLPSAQKYGDNLPSPMRKQNTKAGLKITCFLLLASVISTIAQARLGPLWTYQKMVDQSDLVVIAKPKSSKETTEKTSLLELPSAKVVGVETTFEVRAILKGDKAIKNLVLHHYRQTNPEETLKKSPALVSFDAKNPQCFLLFVKREADARYAPVTGQTDPAILSVLKLEGRAY